MIINLLLSLYHLILRPVHIHSHRHTKHRGTHTHSRHSMCRIIHQYVTGMLPLLFDAYASVYFMRQCKKRTHTNLERAREWQKWLILKWRQIEEFMHENAIASEVYIFSLAPELELDNMTNCLPHRSNSFRAINTVYAAVVVFFFKPPRDMNTFFPWYISYYGLVNIVYIDIGTEESNKSFRR